jgi:hypothetical protein
MATAYLEGMAERRGLGKSFCDNSSRYIFKKDPELQRRTLHNLETMKRLESKKAINHK